MSVRYDRTMADQAMGRRERKKAQTRQAIADAALELFLERGYDDVGVREVAEVADVALSTLFKHFPTKESLIFDMDDELEAGLVEAVNSCTSEPEVLRALRDRLIENARIAAHPQLSSTQADAFRALITGTPALQDAYRQMWSRHESALAAAIAQTTGAPPGDLRSAGIARFVLAIPDLAEGYDDSDAAIAALIGLLEVGWQKAASRSS